jgi:hypothetical protein
MFICFMAIWKISGDLGHFITIWYILCSFCRFFPFLYQCTKTNLATLFYTVMYSYFEKYVNNTYN